MPLFAKLFASVATGLVSFFALFLEIKIATKLAAYTLWIVTFSALLVSLFVCMQNIFGYINTWAVNGPAWMSFFMMGAGMFIPSNASALMTCQGSIWIATSIYKMQKQGIMNFGS